MTVDAVLAALDEQPNIIATWTVGLPRARLHSAPAAGEWSLSDVLAHLRACADVWGGCIARIVAEDHPTFRAVNPRAWIKTTNYPSLEFASSFEAFRKQRAQLLELLRPLPKPGWSRRATVTGAGRPLERTVHDYAEWLANHERSHLRQIAHLAGE